MALPSPDVQAALAVNRFGLGARPGDLETARGDPRGFLLRQIDGSAQIPAGIEETTPQRITAFRKFVAERKEVRQAETPGALAMARRDRTQDFAADFMARAGHAATTPDGFAERWATLFANHFTVSAVKQQTATLVGPFEQEAIRPHVFGRFEDMLVASSSHPAMLLYLDQAQSTGPNSPAALRAKDRQRAPGLNENLAREILELHTLGVDAGYTQADVTELARAMTGWSIAREGEPEGEGAFRFRPAAHEPGSRTVMGHRYAEGGFDQARAVMKDLAASPHTARHLARKIAQHFVADDPPPALVERLRKAYLDGNGRLDLVAKTLVESPEAWDPQLRKFKTPYEFMVSSWRAAGQTPPPYQKVGPVLTALGQRPFGAPSPKGWSDVTGDWCAPDALIKRMTWAQGLAASAGAAADPVKTARDALGPQLTAPVATAVARAESRPEALALLLMSPEFQRR